MNSENSESNLETMESTMEQNCSDKTESDFMSKPSEGKMKLRRLLNRNMKITMTDGRTLVGLFLCTDRACNVILGSCHEYLNYGRVESSWKENKSVSPLSSDASDGSTETLRSTRVEEPRVLGLAMVPGHHIVSIQVDDPMPDSAEEDEGGAVL